MTWVSYDFIMKGGKEVRNATHCLVPAWVCVWNKISEWFQRLRFFTRFLLDWLAAGGSDWLLLLFGSRLRWLDLFLRVQRANLQFWLVLFQDRLVMVLPELLGGILSTNTLKN
jgi:hypothetical protein